MAKQISNSKHYETSPPVTSVHNPKTLDITSRDKHRDNHAG